MTGNAETNQTTSKGTHLVVTTKVVVRNNHLAQPIDCPDVCFNSVNSNITVDFGNQPVDDYVVTISTPFVDFDYYATSSFTTIPLAVDGISDYSITIETADGDMFEGTLYASEYTSNATF